MANIDQLLDDLIGAVAATDQKRFDELERQLLARFDGGLSGMPKEIYARYLEIDRGWSAMVAPPGTSPASRDADQIPASLGPKTAVSVRLPESLIDWIAELTTVSGANRPELLTACLVVARENPAVREAVLERIRRERR